MPPDTRQSEERSCFLRHLHDQPDADWMHASVSLLDLDQGNVLGYVLMREEIFRKSLARCVSNGYTFLMKDSGLRIRVERELRERFLALCRRLDRPAAQVIREFMKDYIAKHENEHVDNVPRFPSNDQARQKKKRKGH